MLTSATIVDTLLEGDKLMKNTLKRMFKPGSRWNRINYNYPSKMIDPQIHKPYTVPAGTAVRVMVVGARNDGVVFMLPSGEQSHLAWPDDTTVWAEQVGTGVELHCAKGKLLSYTPA